MRFIGLGVLPAVVEECFPRRNVEKNRKIMICILCEMLHECDLRIPLAPFGDHPDPKESLKVCVLAMGQKENQQKERHDLDRISIFVFEE